MTKNILKIYLNYEKKFFIKDIKRGIEILINKNLIEKIDDKFLDKLLNLIIKINLDYDWWITYPQDLILSNKYNSINYYKY